MIARSGKKSGKNWTPRKNVVGWAAAIIMLVVVCVFGGINNHPAEPAMRPATIVSK